MDTLTSGEILHQIYLERYKNGQANKIIALLDTANKRIAKEVRRTSAVATKARYREIAKFLKEVSAALRKSVEDGTDINGIIGYELRKQRKLLKGAGKYLADLPGGNTDFIFPSAEQVRTAALFAPVTDGMTFQSYLEGIEAGLYNTWDSHVRTGYLAGQATRQIVRDVLGSAEGNPQLADRGAMRSFRNSVYMNTRTVLQSFAAETRNAVFERNEQYFGSGGYKYQFLATLDTRTCKVCAVYDGKLYRSLKDAPEVPVHTGCILGDTFVSTVGGITKVYKRRYKGLIYRITTASGNVLSVTPNHPVLTDKGFIRAHLLNVGDNVISDNGLETLGIVGKNENNRQALIKDVFRAFRKSPSMFSCTVPLAAEDFHGDAVYNKVNIVTADGKLHGERNVICSEKIPENFLIDRFGFLANKMHKRRFFQVLRSHFSAFRSLMGIFCKFGDFFWSGMSHALNLLLMPIPKSDVVPLKERNYGSTTVSKPLGNSCDADSLIVKLKNLVNRKIVRRAFSRCADIGVMQDVSDDVFGGTVLARNILDGYSAQIKADNIVAVDVKFSFTHVYNLETENNWYVANGIITHNCRCLLVPYVGDIDGETRAAMDGPVDAETTYAGWLAGQTDEVQLDVLGRARYKMYKAGTPITAFVDNGKVLTLKQLDEKLGE